MSRRLAVAAAIIAAFVLATDAFAQPGRDYPPPAEPAHYPPSPVYGPEPAPAPTEISYQRDIAKADAVAGGLVGAATLSGIICFAEAFGSESSETPVSCVIAAGSFIAGGAVYTLGSPIIHINKGQPGRAVLALAARVGLPVLGYHLGEAAGSDSSTGWGVVAGFSGALLLDWFVLAKKEAPVGPRPYVAPSSGGLSAGIGGAF